VGNSNQHPNSSPGNVLELSTFKHQTNNAFRSIFSDEAFKNGKAAHFNNEPLFFTGWHKAALMQN
jgi:hypothetical protein